jgi:thiol-disulfide isomerase/thioredoxin
MSKEQQPREHPRDIFSLYKQNVDKYFENVEQSVPRYHQSITNVQQEYLHACENVIDSVISLQKEFANKAGLNTNVPEATLKVVRDITEETIKAFIIQNQVIIAAIDATPQNIKTFNDNSKSFADLNKNIVQSWISTFNQKNN